MKNITTLKDLNAVSGGLKARKAAKLVAFAGSSALALPVLGLGNYLKCLACLTVIEGGSNILLDGLTLAESAENIIKTASKALTATYLFKGQHLAAPNTYFDESKLASNGTSNNTKTA